MKLKSGKVFTFKEKGVELPKENLLKGDIILFMGMSFQHFAPKYGTDRRTYVMQWRS